MGREKHGLLCPSHCENASPSPSHLQERLPRQPWPERLPEGAEEAGPILPNVPTVQRDSEDAEAPAPSAYLMLKPVVWSSLSQLCSFASSL